MAVSPDPPFDRLTRAAHDVDRPGARVAPRSAGAHREDDVDDTARIARDPHCGGARGHRRSLDDQPAALLAEEEDCTVVCVSGDRRHNAEGGDDPAQPPLPFSLSGSLPCPRLWQTDGVQPDRLHSRVPPLWPAYGRRSGLVTRGLRARRARVERVHSSGDYGSARPNRNRCWVGSSSISAISSKPAGSHSLRTCSTAIRCSSLM